MLEKYRVKDEIYEKGYLSYPLTEEQQELNRKKAKTRCREVHIFDFKENTMPRPFILTVGLVLTMAVIGLINLLYNIFRY